jgi:catechol 2,3-dioxygenase-like lactoylglutathione lyase family enzyme
MRWTMTAAMTAMMAMGCAGLAAAADPARRDEDRPAPLVTRATPILHVERVEPSVAFWTDRLGFRKVVEVPEGDRVGFAMLSNGGTTLMYQTYSGMKAAVEPLARAADQGPTFVFVEVPDIRRVVAAVRGADVVAPLHVSAYGAQEVIVREPGGHFVVFSQLPAR